MTVPVPAECALAGDGGQKELAFGGGEHHRSLVAAFGHDIDLLGRLPLQFHDLGLGQFHRALNRHDDTSYLTVTVH